METSVAESLFLLSSVLVLPAIAVLVTSYLTGSLTATEDAKYIVLRDPEEDYWAQTTEITGGTSVAADLAADAPVPAPPEEGDRR